MSCMFKRDLESCTFDAISYKTGIEADKIKSMFVSEDDLRIKAITYAAVSWVQKIKKILDEIQNRREKLLFLVNLYISGTDSYPQSLSLYIDLWKTLRDNQFAENSDIKSEVYKIYKYYMDMFVELVIGITGCKKIHIPKIEKIGQMLVALSDGLHIQSLFDFKTGAFDYQSEILCRMLEDELL